MKQPANPTAEDSGALGELYQRHVQAMLGHISAHVANLADAEDVLLEVFLAARQRHALVDLSHGEQLAWLKRVATNKCADLYRLEQRRPVVALESVEHLLQDEGHSSPEVQILHQERLALLYRHLAELPMHQQMVVRLYFAHDLPGREIARLLQKKESTVRMTLTRALNRLRAAYEREQVREGVFYE